MLKLVDYLSVYRHKLESNKCLVVFIVLTYFRETFDDLNKSKEDIRANLEKGLDQQEKMYHKIIDLISKKKGEILQLESEDQ